MHRDHGSSKRKVGRAAPQARSRPPSRGLPLTYAAACKPSLFVVNGCRSVQLSHNSVKNLYKPVSGNPGLCVSECTDSLTPKWPPQADEPKSTPEQALDEERSGVMSKVSHEWSRVLSLDLAPAAQTLRIVDPCLLRAGRS